ncbi:MAG TPA: DUF4160 domain-containing protein [Roseiflexaceae bacterium]|jgi:hypothetical protein|nr:DUF4160 domain-containing protein [Roseiflexaceae bacterium]
MPQISAFYGIVIAMYFNDHVPPHFHAIYASDEATINIETGEVIDGELPRRALRLVREWAAAHREELRANWDLARQPAPLNQIAPLD